MLGDRLSLAFPMGCWLLGQAAFMQGGTCMKTVQRGMACKKVLLAVCALVLQLCSQALGMACRIQGARCAQPCMQSSCGNVPEA